MPAYMREELEKAAKKRDRKLSQEVLSRLNYSLNESRRKSRDRSTRGISYLIEEIAEGVTLGAHNVLEFPDLRPLWRSNPFLFRAFKLAVGKLLDALEPTGEIKSPAMLQVAKNVQLDLTQPRFVADIYKTPEALADFVATGILHALTRTTLKKQNVRNTKWDWDGDYGMKNARDDLSLERKGEKL
jgi:hypothetical protein